MIPLDTRTVFFANIFIISISFIILLQLWRQQHARYRGLTHWVLFSASVLAGAILISLRGKIPDLVSVVLANGMISGGFLILYFGIQTFVAKKKTPLLNYSLIGYFIVFVFIHFYFSAFQDSLTARLYNSAISLSLFSFAGAWLVFRGGSPGNVSAARGVGIFLIAYGTGNIFRMFGFYLWPLPGSNLMNSGAFDVIMVLLSAGLVALISFNLVLMVNKRLSDEHKRVEETLRESEESFRGYFNMSTVGMCVTSLEKGWIEVNDQLCHMFGYTREELAGRTWAEMTHPEDLAADTALFEEVLEGKRESYELDKRFLRKDGSIIHTSLYATCQRNQDGSVHHMIASLVDMTERKQAEQELRESEERLELVMEGSQLGYWDWNIEAGTVHRNQRWAAMLGYTLEEIELSVRQWTDLHHPDDREAAWKSIQDHLQGRTSEHRIEYRMRTKDGEYKWILDQARVVKRDAQGKPMRMSGTHTDITDRKRAEEALQESEEEFRSLAESMPQIVWITRPDGWNIYFNQQWVDYTGLTLEESYGHGWNKPFHPDDKQRAWDAWQNATQNGATYSLECRLRRADGAYKWWLIRGVPLLDSGGTILKWFGTCTDIEELKQAEAARQKFVMLADSSSEFIGMCDFDFKPLYVNPAGVRMVGLPDMAAACQVKVQDYFYQEDQRFITEEFFPRVLREGHGDVEIRLRHFQTGEPIWMFYYLFSVRDANGEIVGWATVSRDITERKRAEQENAKLQDQLLQSQKMESVGRLAGGVAHDFNNMLGLIIGHAELALEQVDSFHLLYTDLQEIKKAAERSANLTNQLLAFARKQVITPKVLDLNDTISGMFKMLQRLIGEDISLAWLPAANLWPVKIDSSQLVQILTNLCINARDAIADVGKITIETENISFDKIYCDDHPGFVVGDYVLTSVSDNGIGMDKEIIAKVFEPFFTTKEMGKGTGLGLATVYGIVKQNNGFINVYSELTEGTTFRIYLPRHIMQEEQIQQRAVSESIMCGNETILLVEDEPSLLELNKIMLERQGYRVLAADTPGEAIRLAKEHAEEIHLLMTDVIMPEMNGRDLAKNLLALYPYMKRLFTSGYTADVIAHHGVLDEGVHFMQKPFSRKDLAAKVREVLDQK